MHQGVMRALLPHSAERKSHATGTAGEVCRYCAVTHYAASMSSTKGAAAVALLALRVVDRY